MDSSNNEKNKKLEDNSSNKLNNNKNFEKESNELNPDKKIAKSNYEINKNLKNDYKEKRQNIHSIIKDNKRNIIVSFLIVSALIFTILIITGVNDVISVSGRTNFWILGLTFIIQIFVYLLWTLRWRFILNKMDQSPQFFNVFGILMTSIFGNNITPGSIGGEPLRAYFLKEYNNTPVEVGFASTMADRVFELLPFLLMSIVATLALLSWELEFFSKVFLIILILATLFLFSIIIYAGINKKISKKIIFKILDWIFPLILKISNNRYTLDKIKENAVNYIDNFNSSFSMIVENKLFIIGAILALLTWGLDLFNSYLSFVAIGIIPPIAPFITIYTIAILLSFLPLLPGSLGITEIIKITLFVSVGITANYVLAASALERLVSYILPTVLGMIAAIYYTRFISRNHKLQNH